MQQVRSVAIIALLVASGNVFAEDAAAWLDRMSHSFRELNYHGTFSFQRGKSTESFRIAHAVIDGEEYERLDYLDGEKRRIVRRGHSLNCIHTGQKLVRSLVSLNQVDQGEKVADSYGLELRGEDRVAGRQAVNLAVIPKDGYRYGYRLSLDTETGLLLRSELLGGEGDVKERFQFVELDIVDSIPATYFDQEHFDYQARHNRPPVDPVTSAPESWRLEWKPPGFSSVINKGPGPGGGATYTDGLAVFSIFLEPIDEVRPKKAMPGFMQKGATSVYTRLVTAADHPYRVTVVGEVPQQTAQKLAESVRILVEQ